MQKIQGVYKIVCEYTRQRNWAKIPGMMLRVGHRNPMQM